MTLIVPGVINGSRGPLLYPLETLQQNTEAWNGMPLVVYHPNRDGKPVSARDPDVINESGVGHLYRTSVVNGKLVAEGWFDVARLQAVDNRVLEAIESGKHIELSTGLDLASEPAEPGAVFNGVPYEATVKSMAPDHVAILPDQIGACSTADGCGVLVNEEGNSLVRRIAKWFGIQNQPSHDDVRSTLNALLQSRFGVEAWVMDVFDKFVVFHNDEKLWRIGYTVDNRSDDKINLSQDGPTEVRRVTQYKPVSNEHKEIVMDREKVINTIIQKHCCWNEEDRKTLEGFGEEKLKAITNQMDREERLERVANAARAGFESDTSRFVLNEETGQWEEKPKQQEQPTKEKQEATTQNNEEEWYQNAPPSVRERLDFADRELKRQKEEVINRLVANVKEEADRSKKAENLRNKPLDELQELASLIPESKPEKPTVNYLGAAGAPVETGQAIEQEPLPVMTLNDFKS
jgi:hypothetical protein